MKNSINFVIKPLSGNDARLYWKDIADLRMDMYKDFPYLYKGSLDCEKKYLDYYFDSPNSLFLLVFIDEKIVGVSRSIPLGEEMEEIKNPFFEKNYNLGEYFYIGEGAIKPSYRSKELVRQLFTFHEEFSKTKGIYNQVFMTIKRPLSHPQRPHNYRSLEPLWQYFGYSKMKNLVIKLAWQQVDTFQEEENYLDVWRKN